MELMKLLYLDTETAGLTPDHALLEVALLIEIDGKIEHELNIHLQPDPTDKIDQKALEVNHLTDEQLASSGRITTTEAYRRIKSVFLSYVNKYDKADKLFLVGQNTGFDHSFLSRLWEKNGDPYLGSFIHYHKIDLIALTAAFKMVGVLPSGDALPNMKLESLCKFFKLGDQTHTALDDIRKTREIFILYLSKMGYLKPFWYLANHANHQNCRQIDSQGAVPASP